MAVAVETRNQLATKFDVIFPHLDERQRRLLMAAEARLLGHGGIRAVARAAGVREATVSAGVDELEAGAHRGAGSAGPAEAVSGPPNWIWACGRRCWPWSNRTNEAIRCRRCGGRPDPPAGWPTR